MRRLGGYFPSLGCSLVILSVHSPVARSLVHTSLNPFHSTLLRRIGQGPGPSDRHPTVRSGRKGRVKRRDTSRSIGFLFLLARVILASSCPSFTRYARHSLASCPFSIPSAPRGTREECNDDRRAETPERMGCGMEKE